MKTYMLLLYANEAGGEALTPEDMAMWMRKMGEYSDALGKADAFVSTAGLGRSRDASEDVVQEVFLAVWRKAGTYRPERGDVAGWLYTMTRNKVVDLWRKLPTGSDQSSEETLAALSERPEAESRVVSISLRKAMADLKVEQRQALELAYFGGLTYEETAERLKLPVGTLKSRIRAGLALMRGVLAESGSSSL